MPEEEKWRICFPLKYIIFHFIKGMRAWDIHISEETAGPSLYQGGFFSINWVNSGKAICLSLAWSVLNALPRHCVRQPGSMCGRLLVCFHFIYVQKLLRLCFICNCIMHYLNWPSYSRIKCRRCQTNHESQYFWTHMVKLTCKERGVIGRKVVNIYSNPVNAGSALIWELL